MANIQILNPETKMARLTINQVKSIAHQIKEACVKYGWKYDVRGEVLTIHKYFTPGDLDGFRDADMEYYSIIGLLPNVFPLDSLLIPMGTRSALVVRFILGLVIL